MVNVKRGVGVHPHPHQPSLILPSWVNVRQKAAVTTLCTLWFGIFIVILSMAPQERWARCRHTCPRRRKSGWLSWARTTPLKTTFRIWCLYCYLVQERWARYRRPCPRRRKSGWLSWARTTRCDRSSPSSSLGYSPSSTASPPASRRRYSSNLFIKGTVTWDGILPIS